MTGYSSYQFMLFRLAVALPLLANLWPLPRNSGPLLWLALPWILGALLLLILLGAFRRIASVLFLSIFLAQIVPGLLRPPMNPDQWLALLGPVASFLILVLAPGGEALALRPKQRHDWRLPVWLYAFGLLAFPASLVLYLWHPELTAVRWSVALGIFALPLWLLSGRRNESNPPIVFFDGVCGLCNSSVDFIQSEDHRHIFKFSPLQGDTARRILAAETLVDLKSIVYVDEKGQYERSSAILRIGTRLGNLWTVAWLGFLVPASLRNALYDFIARHRYRWFGKKEACRIPTAEERAYFLP